MQLSVDTADDPELLAEMGEAGLKNKKFVYDNRIVTFAPLYMSNLCVNGCLYCGFRKENEHEVRRKLSMDEVRRETVVLAGKIGLFATIILFAFASLVAALCTFRQY